MTRLRELILPIAGLLPACAHPPIDMARTYQSVSQIPLAVEYLSTGAAEDEESKATLVELRALHAFQVNEDLDRLSSRPVEALGRLLWLEEQAATAGDQLPAEFRQELATRHDTLRSAAKRRVEADLDRRAQRGSFSKADLATCRSLSALEPKDEAIALRCQQMRDSLGNHATIRFAGVMSQELNALFVDQITRAHPELLELVAPDSAKLDAEITLELLPFQVTDTPWTQIRHESDFVWVQRLDDKGKPILEEVVEVADDGTETKKKKPTFDLLPYDVKTFEARREVRLDYRLTLRSLRTENVLVSVGGTLYPAAASHYHEASGDPRAIPSQSTPEGPASASKIPSAEDLVRPQLPGIAEVLARKVLEKVE